MLKEHVELADTVKLMGSPDWRARLKAEYWQLKIRTKKLENALLSNKLPWTHKGICKEQLNGMHSYMEALEKKIRLCDLNDYINDISDMI